MRKRWVSAGAVVAAVWMTAWGCSKTGTVTSPSAVSPAAVTTTVAGEDAHRHGASQPEDKGDKGFINGWFEGSDVQLYYTKSYYCAKLPDSTESAAPCEIGAPPDEAPRPGRIPTIYAIAAAGFMPPPGTASCEVGKPCLDHPAMLDLSRVRGPNFTSAPPLSHSHILSAHGGGWFNTVNIRVLTVEAWNQIADAKSLAKVRELQRNDTEHGTPGVISGDTPTNIYFFIASWRPN